MPEYRVEARLDATMAAVFAALVHELAEDRWSDGRETGADLPRAGLRFGYRQARRLYSGEVLECLRPVSIIIVERYCGPAASIVSRQRWRVEPLETATRLRGDIRIEPNRFARLQLRFWRRHFLNRAQRTCSSVRRQLGVGQPEMLSTQSAHSGTTGQNSGRHSIVSTNTTKVSGRPIFR